MQVLASQPDHLTWVTQDVFALSIVVMEWLTYGMFTYPYNREEPSPSYSHLLLFELEVYDLLLTGIHAVYKCPVALKRYLLLTWAHLTRAQRRVRRVGAKRKARPENRPLA